MVRAISFIGFGGGFLMISPKLRDTVYGTVNSGVAGMEAYAPYSYVGAGMLLVIAFGVSLYRGAQPR
jgi:hypothetical protein